MTQKSEVDIVNFWLMTPPAEPADSEQPSSSEQAGQVVILVHLLVIVTKNNPE